MMIRANIYSVLILMWLTLVVLTLLCASEPPRRASEVVRLRGAEYWHFLEFPGDAAPRL